MSFIFPRQVIASARRDRVDSSPKNVNTSMATLLSETANEKSVFDGISWSKKLSGGDSGYAYY